MTTTAALRTRPTPLPYPAARPTRAGTHAARPPHLDAQTADALTRPGSAGPAPLPAVRLVPAADPAPIAGRLAGAVVEVLRGTRPLHQLARWVSLDVFGELESRVAAASTTPRDRRPQPAETLGRVTVLRVRVCRLGPLVAEACAVVQDGDRVRAVAVRLEGRRGQWSATALEVG